MDFSYENNKGLHAFFLALVMILGIFTVFAPVKSYASTNVVPLPTEEFKVLKVDFKAGWEGGRNTGDSSSSVPYGFGLDYIRFSSSDFAKKVATVKVYNATTKKDLSSSFIVSATNNSVKFPILSSTTGEYQKLYSQGDVLEMTITLSEKVPSYAISEIEFNTTSSYISSAFFKTAPMPPAVIQAKEVKELPTVLGKVAGIVTLVGCLILGILLAVGLVRRLISLFIR